VHRLRVSQPNSGVGLRHLSLFTVGDAAVRSGYYAVVFKYRRPGGDNAWPGVDAGRGAVEAGRLSTVCHKLKQAAPGVDERGLSEQTKV